MSSDGGEWKGGWDVDVEGKRDAWSATTPQQRLAWLESALTFAAETGALRRDRARRAAAARAWTDESQP